MKDVYRFVFMDYIVHQPKIFHKVIYLWAQCILPTTEGGVSGIGRNPNLQPSALVMGFFADGENSQTPIVVGSIPHIEFPTILQTEQAN